MGYFLHRRRVQRLRTKLRSRTVRSALRAIALLRAPCDHIGRPLRVTTTALPRTIGHGYASVRTMNCGHCGAKLEGDYQLASGENGIVIAYEKKTTR